MGIAIHNDQKELDPNEMELEKNRRQEFEIDENAALENVHMMINEQRENLLNFDKETRVNGINSENARHYEQLSIEDVKKAQSLDFSYVPQDTFNEIISTPKSFIGDLKEYQLKGLFIFLWFF